MLKFWKWENLKSQTAEYFEPISSWGESQTKCGRAGRLWDVEGKRATVVCIEFVLLRGW